MRLSPFGMLILILLIPVLGYGAMHAIVYLFPMTEESDARHFIITFFIIALGLAVPYWLLKAGFHKGHLENPSQDELHIGDLPKNDPQDGPQPQQKGPRIL